MPSYPGAANSFVPAPSNASPVVLGNNDSVYLLGQLVAGATQLPVQDLNVTFEAAPAGATQSSIAANIANGPDDDSVPSLQLEVHCNGVPGAGESIAIQVADTDADGFYATPSDASYTLATFNANNVGRAAPLPVFLGKFVRIVRTKGANAVGITAKLSRLA